MFNQLYMLTLMLHIIVHFVKTWAQINTNITANWNIGSGALSMTMERHYHWGQDIAPDIEFGRVFTLEEAHSGSSFSFRFRRTVIRKECKVAECPFCRGTGSVVSKSSTEREFKKSSKRSLFSSVIASTIMPCPRCLGAGMGSQLCHDSIYTHRDENIDVNLLPHQIRPGFKQAFKGMGHELYQNKKVVIGDMYLRVDAVRTENFVANANGDIVLSVELSPWSALYGFELSSNTSFLPGNASIMKIDRIGKTTLPGTEVRMVGKGLTPSGALVVSFSLAPEEVESPIQPKLLQSGILTDNLELDESHAFDSNDAAAELRRNETLAAAERKRVERAKDQMARKILAMLDLQLKRKDD